MEMVDNVTNMSDKGGPYCYLFREDENNVKCVSRLP